MKTNTYLLLLLLIGCWGCTPKTVDQTTTTDPEPAYVPPAVDEATLSPCPKFRDAPNPDAVETNYVLYRDFLKAGDYDQAYTYWQKVYEVAPAADGQRNTVMADGIFFYELFMSQDTSKRDEYIGKVFEMYDKIDECYPEGGYVDGRKAFDYFYKYPDKSTKQQTYQLFKTSLEADGEKAQYFIINPMASLVVDLYFDDKLSMEEAKMVSEQLRARLEKGKANCKGEMCDAWAVIDGYLPERLAAFETVKGFYDCEYFVNKYYPDFQEDQADGETDCDVVRTVYSRFVYGGCSNDNPRVAEVIAVGNDKCVEERTPGTVGQAYNALREARYNDAVQLFDQAIDEASTNEDKAKYALVNAKIYNAHLRNFSKSRQYARQASEYRPNWGEPYILVGRLYASSGPLCGPGTGFDSQVVVWVAIDEWNKAKRVDPGVATEANKWIGRYSKYMPSREDIFQRSLSEGGTYRVGCWIQQNTTIRAAS